MLRSTREAAFAAALLFVTPIHAVVKKLRFRTTTPLLSRRFKRRLWLPKTNILHRCSGESKISRLGEAAKSTTKPVKNAWFVSICYRLARCSYRPNTNLGTQNALPISCPMGTFPYFRVAICSKVISLDT